MENLAKARRQAGRTQQEVADYLGISRQAYSNYETGKREPDCAALVRLGAYFDCSTDYLLVRETAPRSAATEEEIKFALFHGGPVTDAQYEEVKQFVRFIKERDANGGKP